MQNSNQENLVNVSATLIRDLPFDRSLHHQFVKLGNNRRKLTNELLALLPEIYERKIYKKYAVTIIEYAGKFGGLSKGVVLKRLRLEKYLKDKPKLKEAIKTEGINKIALVASLATTENESAWLDKVNNMSKAALQELTKEVRSNQEMNVDWNEPIPCKAVPTKITFELDEEMTFLFLKLKQKIGKNLSNREVMKRILEVVGLEIQKRHKTDFEKGYKFGKKSQAESVKIIPGDRNSRREFPDANEEQDNFDIQNNKRIEKKTIVNQKSLKNLRSPNSRYLPILLKKIALQSTAGQCSYPNCNKPSEIFHHTERFAISHSHQSIRPLCKVHHEFAHNGADSKRKR